MLSTLDSNKCMAVLVMTSSFILYMEYTTFTRVKDHCCLVRGHMTIEMH